MNQHCHFHSYFDSFLENKKKQKKKRRVTHVVSMSACHRNGSASTGYAFPWRCYTVSKQSLIISHYKSVLIGVDADDAVALLCVPNIGAFLVKLNMHQQHDQTRPAHRQSENRLIQSLNQVDIRTLWLSHSHCTVPTRTATHRTFEGVGALEFEAPYLQYTHRNYTKLQQTMRDVVWDHVHAYHSSSWAEFLYSQFRTCAVNIDYDGSSVRSVTEMTCMRCHKEECTRRRRVQRQSIATRVEYNWKFDFRPVNAGLMSDVWMLAIPLLAILRVIIRNTADRSVVEAEVVYWARAIPQSSAQKQSIMQHLQAHFDVEVEFGSNERRKCFLNIDASPRVHYTITDRSKRVE